MKIVKRKIKRFEQFILNPEDPNQDINNDEEILLGPDPVPVEEETPEEKDLVDEFEEYFEGLKNKK